MKDFGAPQKGEKNDMKTKESNAKVLHAEIKDQTGKTWMFKLKRTTKFDKMFREYAKRAGAASMNKMQFIWDGRSVTAEDTADSLGMDDRAELEVFSSQIGG